MVPSWEGKILPRNAGSAEEVWIYANTSGQCLLQCFDVVELKRIKNGHVEMKWINLVQLIAYTDWNGNTAEKKQPDGRWVNYNYDWMFKPGAMKRGWRNMRTVLADTMLVAEGSAKGNIKLTGMVQDGIRVKWR